MEKTKAKRLISCMICRGLMNGDTCVDCGKTFADFMETRVGIAMPYYMKYQINSFYIYSTRPTVNLSPPLVNYNIKLGRSMGRRASTILIDDPAFTEPDCVSCKSICYTSDGMRKLCNRRNER